jgi:hypothetical protein
MIVRSGKPADEKFSPSAVPLVSSANVANLKRIVCNVQDHVLLRVLACKGERAVGKADVCPYPDHKNNGATRLACVDCNNVLAQIYIRLEHSHDNQSLRSCIIAFGEGQYLSKTDDLLQRMQYSIAWLDIEHERPHFFIFYYGQPMAQLIAKNSQKFINDRIKKLYNFYSPEEDVCIVPRLSAIRNR